MQNLDMDNQKTMDRKTILEENIIAPTVTKKKRGRKTTPITPRIAIPIRSLWMMASMEEKIRARETALLMMDYWMGRQTKIQIANALGVPTVRIWQMSQMAFSGMCAAMLKQPKGKIMKENKEDDPKVLKKKILELE